MNIYRTALRGAAVICAFAVAACSTTAQFRLPPESRIRLGHNDRLFETGEVKTLPYFWSSAGGIPYRLEQDGKLLSEGRLSARFRVASIFWPPPNALLYWPIGFGWPCYDLTSGTPQRCQ